ncbi:xin actin-binding repeat-containing protein 2-like isoform X4 [Argopecten irradians]|uniref:xin actin-binding repeat-containing protein 2-like isoform X4 n=1 Tax=Argopecten irradians TaxID=31199 RepID=UPI0037229922
MSQFDALLDFGDSAPAANGTVQKNDDFDPFAASPTIDMKGSATGDLLGDFSFDSQVSQQTNGTHNDTDLLAGFSAPSNNINPLYDLINSETEPDEALTNNSAVPSSNPLYEMSTDYEEPQKPDMASTEPDNPMYGYLSSEENTNGSPSEDLMGTSTTVTSDDSGVTMETAQTNEEELIMVSGEKSVVENGENVSENVNVVNGDASSYQEELVCDQGEIIQNDVQEEVAPQEDATSEQVEQEIPGDFTESVDNPVVESYEEEEGEEIVEEVSMDSYMQSSQDEQNVAEQAQDKDSRQMEVRQEAEQVIEPVQTEEVETQPDLVQTDEPQVPEPVAEPKTCLEPEPVQADVASEPEEQYVEEEVIQEVQEEVQVEPQSQEEEVAPQPLKEEVAPQPQEEEEALQPQEEEITPQTLEEEVAPQVEEEEVTSQPQEVETVPQFQEEVAPQEEPSVSEDQEEVAPQEESSMTQDQEEINQEVVTEQKDGKTVTTKTEETSTTKQEDSGPTVTTSSKSSSEVVENGLNDAKENKEEVRFDDMANIKNKFEAGDNTVITSAGKVNVHEEILNVQSGEFENEPEKFEQWQNQTEGGVYESQPQENPDVFKESQKNVGEELPEVGMAKYVMEKFKKIQEESYTPEKKKELTPDRTGKYEYVSEPRSVVEKPKEVVEAGVFESQPTDPEDVVRSSDHLEEALPEQGSAKSLLAKFKQIESEVGNKPPPSPGQRELTPDRNTKGEYVSEPRSRFQQYEGKVESGEFVNQPEEVENIVKSGEGLQEVLPEKGTAQNLVSKFKQYQSESSSPPSPRQKKELTPDRSGKVEYVSEPRGQIEAYEGKSEAGIFESSPVDQPEIVKSGDFQPEPLPEEGYAKNVAAKFKELEKSGGSSPSGTPVRHKEFTPPREDMDRTVAGVLENTPESLDIARETDTRLKEDELPERGMAKNVLNKFKEIQSNSPTSPRTKKEFTPPPDQGSGIFENKPTPSLEIDVRQAESGILESTPVARQDVVKEQMSSEEIVPEQGYAKNMVNRWKQMESESAKSSPSPRYKEFTPPRDNLMSPKSPAGLNSSVNPNDLPGQYQEQVSAGVYENTPEHKEGVFREADTDFEEGLPAKDTTKSLLQRFKSIQSQAKEAQETPKPVSRKESIENGTSPAPETKKMFEQEESGPPCVEPGDHGDGYRGDHGQEEDQGIPDQDSPTPDQHDQAPIESEKEVPIATKKPSFVPVLDKCASCGKTVYALEKVEVNKSLYHKACVRCSHCNAVVTSKNMSVNEGVIFCTPHFKQLFARRGNYDEGFGRKQYKKNWGGEQNGQSGQQNGQTS